MHLLSRGISSISTGVLVEILDYQTACSTILMRILMSMRKIKYIRLVSHSYEILLHMITYSFHDSWQKLNITLSGRMRMILR